ncbi:LysR family transcriptional regulator [Photobacterium sp. BZF1]|uniref:LysR family transcriptional regulator n=1 Tax=Photobacterium sp. BZF1 TaxID=1904457 RepID=UPI001653A40D|nr:LysR family transcriptional regulator [Photobacterium sp. BZF1]MBC7003933.1 LysR family transcriptional regulator [Photobacterium sp. BZF1]
MNRLRQMSLFAHIVESGSITAAADGLGLSKSVVSQHLKLLETELGISLLKRTTRRQTLTQAGQAFYAECKKLNDLADFAWQQALESQQEPQGKIVITSSDALMSTLVAPAIGSLMKCYPKLRPELISSDQPLNLMEKQIDLAIRVGASSENALMQRRIGEFRDVLCGTQSVIDNEKENAGYLANQWQPATIIHHFTHCIKIEEKHNYHANITCRADSFHTCLGLIESGAGVGIVPDYIFRQKPQLAALFPDHQLASNPVYALHPYPRQPPINVVTCINAIEKQLSILTTPSCQALKQSEAK